MIPSSSCPPRQPDETGQTRRRAHTHCRSYTTPWGTIVAGLETYIGEGFHLFDLYVVYGPELPALWHAGRQGDRKAACRHDLACEMIARAGQRFVLEHLNEKTIGARYAARTAATQVPGRLLTHWRSSESSRR